MQTGLAGSVTAALAAWVGPELAAAGLRADDARRTSQHPSHGARSSSPLHAVLLDERFAEAARFAAVARSEGLRTRAMRGDVTDFWYAELHFLWKQRAVPLAGLTGYATLFCLEQLAWDHRMRVIYRGAHTPRPDGQLEHVLAGPPQALDALAQGCACDWPAAIASIIARTERQGGWAGRAPASCAIEQRCVTRDASRGQRPASTLYSWVIALPSRG